MTVRDASRPWVIVDAGDELEHVDVAPAPSSLSLSAQPREDVWLARGLHRRWRVVSELRTFGEWDERGDAVAFLGLLVQGNDNLRLLP